MAGRGLLNRISSPDPRRHDDVLESVIHNLAAILNTHEGDGHTCPTMGSDFIELLARWPTSQSEVLTNIKSTVERYETRLTQVQVRRLNPDSNRVELEITGQLKDSERSRERIKLRTELSQAGRIKIR